MSLSHWESRGKHYRKSPNRVISREWIYRLFYRKELILWTLWSLLRANRAKKFRHLYSMLSVQ